MKKTLFPTAILLSFFLHSNAQTSTNAMSIQLSGIDFYGPQTGSFFLHRNTNKTTKLYWDPAFQASFWRTISRKIDFKTLLTMSGLNMPKSRKDQNYRSEKDLASGLAQKSTFVAVQTDLAFSFLSKNKYLFDPQVEAGIGTYFYAAGAGVTINIGIGGTFKIQDDLFLLLNSNIYYSLTNRYQSRLQHAIGLKYHFKYRKSSSPIESKISNLKQDEIYPISAQVRPGVKPIELDKDLDGITDKEDQCAEKPGKRALKGCPDRDDDNIADDEDLCPDDKGLVNLNGCPDGDNDGIKDLDDKCPDKFAKTMDGCPEIIKQQVISEEEILLAHKAAAQKVRESAKQISFQPNTFTLDSSIFFALDTIVSVLKQDTLIHVDIEGHTDSSGNHDKNLLLSQQRADACRDYLIRSDIGAYRISSVGYGDMNPIADNKTSEGRVSNRRIEFLLFLSEK